MAAKKKRASAAAKPSPPALLLSVVAVALAALGVHLVLRGDLVQAVREVGGFTRIEAHKTAVLIASEESGVDPYLLAGLMMRESSGRADAVSEAGALGLFQLMMPTAVERAAVLEVDHVPTEEELLTDTGLNARIGANYLAYLLDRFDGSEEAALVAYNIGPSRLQSHIRGAGSYAAWVAERDAAGDSSALPYARRILEYRDRFRDRDLYGLAR